jgi:hypothetical protein
VRPGGVPFSLRACAAFAAQDAPGTAFVLKDGHLAPGGMRACSAAIPRGRFCGQVQNLHPGVRPP